MDKFIYVFSVEDRDMLVGNGLNLIKSDDKNDLYIFENTAEKKFDLSPTSYLFSNILTFSQ